MSASMRFGGVALGGRLLGGGGGRGWGGEVVMVEVVVKIVAVMGTPMRSGDSEGGSDGDGDRV